MKPRLLLSVFLAAASLIVIPSVLTAQSITPLYNSPTVIPTQGGTMKNDSINVQFTYTVGQAGMIPPGVSRNGNLMLTTGFQQPNVPCKAIIPPPQSSCTGDTPVIFIFTNVRSGLLGDSVQYAHNKNFTGKITITSGGTIYDTVAPPVGSTPNIDTIWLRSLNGHEHLVSSAVITTATVNPLPPAAISPDDTTVAPWQPVQLTASGGVSYSWIGFDNTTPVLTVPALRDSASYSVLVTDSKGCSKKALAVVRGRPAFDEDVVIGRIALHDSILTACQADTFVWQIVNSTTSNQTFAIQIGTTYPGSAASSDSIANSFHLIAGSGITDTIIGNDVYLIANNFPPNATHPDTIKYTFSVPCSLIPNTGTVPSIQQIFNVTTGADTILFTGTYSVDSTNNKPDTIGFTFQFPFIIPASAVDTDSLSVGQTGIFSVTYENTHQGTYSGQIQIFGDTMACPDSSVSIQKLVVTGPNDLDTTIIDPHFPVTLNVVIPFDSSIHVKEYVELVDCHATNSCAQNNFYVAWGCPGNLCKNTTANNFILIQKPGRAYVVVSRITPAPGYDDEYEYAWDGSCVNTATQWQFLIINRGQAEADNVTVTLAAPLGIYTYIPNGSISIDTADPRFAHVIGDTIDTAHIVLLDSADFPDSIPTNCFVILSDSPSTVPIDSYVVVLPRLLPNQSVVLNFKTWRCCPSDAQYNTGINFNLWSLPVIYIYCGGGYEADIGLPPDSGWMNATYIHNGDTTYTYYAYNPDNPVPAYISSNTFDYYPNLSLTQSFQQNVVNLYGGHGGCGTSQLFSIVNRYFTGLSPSDYNTQLFCPADTVGGNAGITGLEPRGQFKVEFNWQQGINMDFSHTPVIVGNGIVWYPIVLDTVYPPYAIFDMDTLFFQNNTAHSPIDYTSFQFRDSFFTNSSINFYLMGCCPDTTQNPKITVNTLFNPEIYGKSCQTCFIPLAQDTFHVQILCPGCVTPGVITYDYKLVRSNLGFQDSHNYGIPDSTSLWPALTPITSSYDSLALVNVTGSIAGDTLLGTAKAYLIDGETSGFTYAQWQSYWDSAGSIDTVFKYLYFEEKIPNALAVGLRCISAQFFYKQAGTGDTFTYQIPGVSSANPVLPNFQGKMLFRLTVDSLPGNVHLEPNDSFQVITTYTICTNPTTSEELDVAAAMYVSVDSLTATYPYFGGTPEVGQIFETADSIYLLTHVNGDTGAAAYNPAQQAFFICQGFSTVHYVYPIAGIFQEFWGNNPQCAKGDTIEIGYFINGPYRNIFPYEYRPMPRINPYDYSFGPMLQGPKPVTFQLSIPQGYSVSVAETYTELYTYNNNIQNNVIITAVNGTVVDTQGRLIGPDTFDYYVRPLYQMYSPPFTTTQTGGRFNPNPPNSTYTQSIGSLLMGDEYFFQGMIFTINPICSLAMQKVDTVGPNLNWADIPNYFALCSDTLVNDTAFDSNPHYLTIPDPTIQIAQAAVVPEGTLLDCPFTVTITGDTTVSNLIFYIDINRHAFPGSVSINCISTGANCTGTVISPYPVISGTDTFNRYYVGAFTGGEAFYMQLAFTNCDSIGDTLHIPLHYFWTCDTIPSYLPPDSNLCSIPDSFILNIPVLPVLISASSSIQSGPYSTCASIAYTVNLTNSQTGGVGKLIDTLYIPKNAWLNMVTVHYDTITDTIPFTGYSIAGGADTLWRIPLDSLTAFNDSSLTGLNGINTGGTITLKMYLIANCHLSALDSVIDVLNYTKFCGEDSSLQFNFSPIELTVNGCGPFDKITNHCNSELGYTVWGNPHYTTPNIQISWSNTILNPIPPYQTTDDSTSYADTLTGGSAVYYLTLTDSNNCITKDSVHVSSPISLADSATVNDSCHGTNNGSISLSVADGTPPYTFHWTGGRTGKDIYNLTAGTYNVTVTDSVSCTASAAYTVTQPSLLIINHADTNVTCHGFENGSIYVTGSGGTPGYTYLWNHNSITSNYISLLDTGTYTVTVTDANHCTATASYVITQPLSLIVSITDTNTLCPNGATGSAKATPSGGTPPYSYVWNNLDTASLIRNLTAGYYEVTVTDAHGCTGTEAVNIGTTDNISVLNTTAVVLQCPVGNPHFFPNGQITIDSISGVGPYTYRWNNSDTTNPISGLSGGNFSVTITDALGCTVSATINDPIPDTVSLHFNNSKPACADSAGSISITGITGGTSPYRFAWSNGDTTQNIDSLSPGIYSLTVEDVDNCVYYFSDSLADSVGYWCCISPADTPQRILTADTVLSDTLHIPPGSFVYFSPNTVFIVNDTFTFRNCDVVMGGGSAIVVNSGDTLNILGTTIQGCDTMWIGIIENLDAGVIVDSLSSKRSVIADAIYGIVLEGLFGNDMKMLVNNTDFYKNQYSIILYDYLPLSNADYNISNCYFGMGSYTKMLPAPHGYANYHRPVAGIVDEWQGPPYDISSSFDTVSIPNPNLSGKPNTFQYMNTGIYCINSMLNVYANNFDSIRDYEPFSWLGLFYGSAIVGSPNFNGAGWFNSLTVQTSDTVPDSNTVTRFKDCDFGIKAVNYAINAQNNRMDSVTNGIFTANCANLSLYSNFITATNAGITLNSNEDRQAVLGNHIYVNEPVASDSALTYGISQNNGGSSNGAFIWVNTVYGGRFGIMLNNIYMPYYASDGGGGGYFYISEVFANSVYQNGTASVGGKQAGIYATHCANLAIDGNTVDGNGTTYDTIALSKYHKNGIYYENSTGGELCGNILGKDTGIGYGINLTGLCTGVNVRNNQLHKSTYGLVLQKLVASMVTNAFGSVASDPANLFYGTNGSGSFGGSYRSYTFDSGPYVEPRYYWDTLNNLQTPLPTGPTALIQVLTAGGSYSDLCLSITVPPPHYNELSDSVHEAIANGYGDTLLSSGYTSTGAWFLQRMLYQALCDSVTSIWTGGSIPAKVDSMLILYIDTAADSVLVDFLSDLYGQISYGKPGTVPADSSALLDTSLAHFFSTAQTSDYNAIQKYTNQLQVLQSIRSDTSAYQSAWLTAVSLNAAISGTNQQAANFKTIQDFYLATLAPKDTFTMDSITLATIKNIALQCPYVAGDAVYYARSLYAQYNNTIYFDDIIHCPPTLAGGGSERMLLITGQQPDSSKTQLPALQEFVRVFPNPARDILNLTYHAQTMGQVAFELTDELGQPVLTQQLANGQTGYQFQIANLSDGLYYWRLNDSERTIQSGKVVIIR